MDKWNADPDLGKKKMPFGTDGSQLLILQRFTLKLYRNHLWLQLLECTLIKSGRIEFSPKFQ